MSFQKHVPVTDLQWVKHQSCWVAWAQPLQATSVEKGGVRNAPGHSLCCPRARPVPTAAALGGQTCPESVIWDPGARWRGGAVEEEGCLGEMRSQDSNCAPVPAGGGPTVQPPSTAGEGML